MKDLEDRTLNFAVAVLDLLDALPRSMANKVLSFQLAKSATAVGAIYREARRAETKKDFIHKIGLVSKEASESEYWLLILFKRLESPVVSQLKKESSELARVFIASGRTASRWKRREDDSR